MFSKLIGELTKRACGEGGVSVTQEQQQEALRFVRGMLELARAGLPKETAYGYTLSLTPDEQSLAEQLQEVLAGYVASERNA